MSEVTNIQQICAVQPVDNIRLKQLNGNKKGSDWYDWVVEAYKLSPYKTGQFILYVIIYFHNIWLLNINNFLMSWAIQPPQNLHECKISVKVVWARFIKT